MKQDARKNLHRRKRQKKRLALKKYIAEKKSKTVVAWKSKTGEAYLLAINLRGVGLSYVSVT
jgi:hypothetical protein